MRYTIVVTQEDIDTARTLDRMPTCWCPVALAAKRATGRKVWVEKRWLAIGLQGAPEPEIGIMSSDQPIYLQPHIPLPQEAMDFIDHFDKEYSVEPFNFTLDVDDDEQENQPA